MPIEPYICFNGDFVKEKQTVLTCQNRAFRYGDALFETIRVSSKKIFLFDDHLKRLTKSMGFLKMNVPSSFNKEDLSKQIIKLLNTNRLFQGARLRLTVFRADGGFYTPVTNNISYIIEAEKLENEKYILNKKGLIIEIYDEFKKPVNALSNFKTTNAFPYILAGIYKKENGFDDCILLNQNNNIIEAISSNIFLVKGKSIYTPSIDDGCVAGVMRNKIIDIAIDLKYIVFEDASLRITDLLNADEVFLTNAINGVKWAIAFRTKRYYNTVSKQLIAELNNKLSV